MKVRNNHDLKLAYETLKIYTDLVQMIGTTPKVEARIASLKAEIRAFNNEPVGEERIVSDDGDALLTVFPLPEFIDNWQDADEHFMDQHYREPVHSMYDCTGCIFTTWYKIFIRNNRFWAYHRTCMDV